jgi:hypothetical protein
MPNHKIAAISAAVEYYMTQPRGKKWKMKLLRF